jgi:hypothetical protein
MGVGGQERAEGYRENSQKSIGGFEGGRRGGSQLGARYYVIRKRQEWKARFGFFQLRSQLSIEPSKSDGKRSRGRVPFREGIKPLRKL